MAVHSEECRAAGIDEKAVASIARRLQKAAIDAQRLGLVVFGGSGSGSLRAVNTEYSESSSSGHCGTGKLVVADMDGSWDGGDGGYSEGPDGLLRGES